MKKIAFGSLTLTLVAMLASCTLYLDEPEYDESDYGFDEPVTEQTDLYEVTYQFNEGVHYIQQEPVDDYILMRDDSIVYYAENTPSDLLPHMGEIIYSGFCNMFPDGFAREVIAMEKENGMYKLSCKKANLDDVFKELELDLNVEIDPDAPNPDDNESQTRASSDIRNDLADAKVYSKSVNWSFSLDAPTFQNLKAIYNKNLTESEARQRDATKKKYGISYDGNMAFDIDYKVTKSFMMHFNKGKQQFYYKMTDKTEKTFRLKGQGSLAFRIKLSDVSGLDKVFGKRLPLVKVMAGPVPIMVYIKPEVEFSAGVKGSIYGSFTQTDTSVSGFYYNSNSDKGVLEQPQDNSPWTMKESEGTVGIQAGFYADLNINSEIGLSVAEGLIDGYVKPFLDLEAGLNFDINNKLGDLSKPNDTYFGANCQWGINAGLAINVPVVDAELFRVEVGKKPSTLFDVKYNLYPSVDEIKVIEDKAGSAYTPNYPIFDCSVVYHEGWMDIENPRVLVYTSPDNSSEKPKLVSTFYPVSTSKDKLTITQDYVLGATQEEMVAGKGIKRGTPYEARFVVTRNGKDYQIGEQYFSTRAPIMKLTSFRQLYGGTYIPRAGEGAGTALANKDKIEYRFRVECSLNAASKMYNAGYHLEVKDNEGNDVFSGDFPIYRQYPLSNKSGKVEKWTNIPDGVRTMEIRLLSNEPATFQMQMYPIVYLLNENGSYTKKEYPERGTSWELLDVNINKLSSEPNRADIVYDPNW